MKVVIPVFNNSVSVTVVGIMEILQQSQYLYHQLYPDKGNLNLFDVQLMSTEDSKVVDNSGFLITCHTHISEVQGVDMIFIPGTHGDILSLLAQHTHLIGWIKMQYLRGATVCSTCTGAFFLAAAGILDGKEATTSWFAAEAFRKRFPQVKLCDEKMIVDYDRIISGGATTSFINLCVYLIEKYYGKQMGNYCAKNFMVDKGKLTQKSYTIFSKHKNHQDAETIQAQEFIESKLEEKVTVARVCEQVMMSERSFVRRFKSATGNLPLEYIQRVKVEYAKQLLEEGDNSIKEISYNTGYEDINHFRSIFKRYTGVTPSAYKRMYSFDL